MSLKNLADEYFGSLNPIAARMHTDMKEIKMSYENLWSTLSDDEKQQILCESIIKPEVLLKYAHMEKCEERTNEYAMKVVLDDNNCPYRDEHSGPFSFRTQSQRDLSIFERDKKPKALVKKTVPKKTPPTVVIDQIDLFPIEIESISPESRSTNNTLPKTGLDFLDNW